MSKGNKMIGLMKKSDELSCDTITSKTVILLGKLFIWNFTAEVDYNTCVNIKYLRLMYSNVKLHLHG